MFHLSDEVSSPKWYKLITRVIRFHHLSETINLASRTAGSRCFSASATRWRAWPGTWRRTRCWSVYSGAVAALSNFTQWLAVHFAKAGIRVNAIAPGFFVTRQNEGLLYEEDGKPAARTAKVLAATPMGRFGRPEELNGALMFLLNNEAAGFITGIILPVDGGFSAYSGV